MSSLAEATGPRTEPSTHLCMSKRQSRASRPGPTLAWAEPTAGLRLDGHAGAIPCCYEQITPSPAAWSSRCLASQGQMSRSGSTGHLAGVPQAVPSSRGPDRQLGLKDQPWT